MLRWLGVLVTALVLSGFAFLIISGKYFREGPVVFTLTRTHGVHRGDLGVVAAWVLGMIGLAASARSGDRSGDHPRG